MNRAFKALAGVLAIPTFAAALSIAVPEATAQTVATQLIAVTQTGRVMPPGDKIGRASCRERVYHPV